MHTEYATRIVVIWRSACVSRPFQYMLVCCSLVVLVIVSVDLAVVGKACTTRLYKGCMYVWAGVDLFKSRKCHVKFVWKCWHLFKGQSS